MYNLASVYGGISSAGRALRWQCCAKAGL